MNLGYVRSAWTYRNFILSAIRSEFKGRFASSKIGALWYVLNPLAMATIFALVLSKVLGARIGDVDNEASYAIYLMAGSAAWAVFNEVANRCLNVLLEYGNTMKKIAFPRIALPLIVLGGVLINHALLLAALSVVFAFFGHYPTVHWIALPIAIFVASAFGFGLGMLLGVLNVFLRDIGQAMGVIFQLWFWLTPIIYPLNILPENMQKIVGLNPITNLVIYYQDIMLYQRWPSLQSLAYPSTLAVVLVLLALYVFRRASAEIVDVL